jgi:hypothetical protein
MWLHFGKPGQKGVTVEIRKRRLLAFLAAGFNLAS